MQKGLITGLIIGVIMVILAFQNAIRVPIKLFVLELNDIPIYVVIGVSFILGIIINAIFAFLDKYRLKRLINKLKNRVNDLEEKLIEYREVEENEDLALEDGSKIDGDPGFSYFDDSPMK